MTAPTLRRLPGADVRLQALVAARLRVPFTWGAQDCALFAADSTGACTGVDIAADVRGRYCTERGALRVLRAVHGRLAWSALLVQAAAARLGPQIPAAQARAGDIGLALQAGRHLLAVCVGAQWLAPSERGLVPVGAPEIVWSIECRK